MMAMWTAHMHSLIESQGKLDSSYHKVMTENLVSIEKYNRKFHKAKQERKSSLYQRDWCRESLPLGEREYSSRQPGWSLRYLHCTFSNRILKIQKRREGGRSWIAAPAGRKEAPQKFFSSWGLTGIAARNQLKNDASLFHTAKKRILLSWWTTSPETQSKRCGPVCWNPASRKILNCRGRNFGSETLCLQPDRNWQESESSGDKYMFQGNIKENHQGHVQHLKLDTWRTSHWDQHLSWALQRMLKIGPVFAT